MEKKDIKNNNYPKWLVISLAIFLLIFFFLGVFYTWFNAKYADRFYPGIKLAEVNLSGLTMSQAKKIFKGKIDEFNRLGQNFFYQNKITTIYPIIFSTGDPDLAIEIINFSTDNSLVKIFQLGRDKNLWQDVWQKINLLLKNNSLKLDFILNEEAIKKNLKNNFGQYEIEGANPELIFVKNDFEIIPEKTGLTFNYDQALEKLKHNLSIVEFNPIELNLIVKQPDFKKESVLYLLDSVQEIIEQAPIEIFFNNSLQKNSEEKISLTKKDLSESINFGWNPEKLTPKITFKKNILENKLANLILKINKPVIEAKFTLANGKVMEFKPSEAGQEIDWSATIKNLEENIINQKQNKASVVVKTIEPQIKTDSLNDMGIKELLGIGESNYSGSPINRRKNIKVGAETLNGLLIKPGETFSLNNALGEINAAKGYLPELVIKGTKTVPEYGGGLCQIATTIFRLALNSGLKIIERKPHAYRVSYYEPAGTDATIYSPNPDLKFINDTDSYLLIQTHNDEKENKLRFEFWGTSDGRSTTTTMPKIFNIVPAGETKYIETSELEPKKIKCTETAHAGADAEFTRSITYSDGHIEEETWKSHYRPWQAVCLIGVEETKNNTSTEINIQNQ